jgi:hypothetical protein
VWAAAGVAPTPDGLHWLSAGTDDKVRLWDAASHRCSCFCLSFLTANSHRRPLAARPFVSAAVIQLLASSSVHPCPALPPTATHDPCRHQLVHYPGAFNRAVQSRQLAVSDDGSLLFHPSGSVVQVCKCASVAAHVPPSQLWFARGGAKWSGNGYRDGLPAAGAWGVLALCPYLSMCAGCL